MSRPELQAPPEIYYGDVEAKKYTKNTRNQQIQADMTYRALELMNLSSDEPAMLLDIGCGSGLSGEILDEEGYIWTGVDIAPSMLEVALEREVEGDLFLQDIGQGFGFRPGSFDGAIRWLEQLVSFKLILNCGFFPSVSVLQWLLNAETSHPTSSPPHRLNRFFTTLHSALRNPSRAVFQFYPSSDDQIQLISSIAQKAGFGGGIVVDYPNSKKAKKVFLCLFVGGGGAQQVPQGLDGEVEEDGKARFERRRERERARSKSGKRKPVKGRDWILKKKELYRKRGKESVPRDSKFTGRKRKPVF
ncbi:methyltransferase [Armillaria novae-zelandiae]|uniref:Methyltransferase n=1 Tax=Armillaria novae-zelandiae TaxID=153914 RepID=A0AA39UI76_9AGAR|nr:methyltransferase [Armillaria novae-zelandiae]